MNIRCPCTSSKLYKQCCKRFHDGTTPSTALELMRSRYSAYALRLIDYLIKTTHPDFPGRNPDPKEWKKELMKFSETTRFEGLSILSFDEGDPISTVTFKAELRQGGRDGSFTERSIFEKIEGRWLYKDGVMQAPS